MFASGTAEIRLEKPPGRPFFGGETVTGSICLNMTDRAPAQRLVLMFTGVEKCEWWRTRSDNGKTVTDHYWNKKKFLENQMVIAEYPAGLERGVLNYPFSVVLPPNVPSTTHKSGTLSWKADVKYKLKALVEVQGALKPNLRAKLEVPVVERLLDPRVLQTPTQTEEEKTIRFAGMFSRGSVNMKVASSPPDGVLPGEVIQVRIVVDNKSSATIKGLRIKFCGHIDLWTKGLFGGRETKDDSWTLSVHDVPKEQVQMEKESREFNFSILVPPGTEPSVNGDCVKLWYGVKVAVDGGTMCPDVKASLQVIVVPPQQ
eukprot:tig00000605_g2498.t1